PSGLSRSPSHSVSASVSNDATSILGRVSVVRISRSPLPPGDYRRAGCLPLRHPVLQPSRTEAGLLEDTDRLVGEGAVRTAAVRHDFFVAGQLAQSAAKVSQRNRDRGRKVA